MIAANESARKSIIAENATLQQTTLGAKAASIGMKALAMAANMVAFYVITEALQFVTQAISDYIHRVEIAAERTEEIQNHINDMNSEYKAHADLVSDVAERYEELSQGVNTITNQNISLSDDEYAEFLDINLDICSYKLSKIA